MGLFDSLFGRLSPGKRRLAEETAAVDAIAGTAVSSLSLEEVFEKLAEGVQSLNLDLALQIAARISGPVANSQRYADLERESEEHAALAEIGRIVGPTPDVREAYRGLGRIARGLIPFDRFAVVIVDRSAGKATYDYVQGVEIAGWGVGDTFAMAGTPVGTVARDRAGLIELASSPEELASKVPSEAPGTAVGYRSIMLVPVVSGEQVVAVFTFGSAKADAYSSADLSRAGKIAAQAAGAVASSVWRARQRREADEEASLTEVATTMASVRDIGDVYEGFAEKVRALIPSDLVIVALVDLKAHEIAISWVSRGGMASGPEVGATFPMGETVFQALVGTVLGLSEGADSAEELSARLPEWPFIGEAGVLSLVAVPLVADDLVIGTLVLCSNRTNAYGVEALALAGRIGSRIAGPIANARLIARLRRETKEADLLREIAQLASSTPAAEDAYTPLAEKARRLVPFDRIEIATLDEQAETLTLTYVSGTEVLGSEAGLTVPLSGSAVEEAVWARSPFVVHAGSPEDVEPPFPSLAPAIDAGLRSFMAAPLVSGGEVVGVLSFGSMALDVYDESRMGLARRIASRIAGPIAHERLTSELARRANEREVLDDIARLIASADIVDDAYEALGHKISGLIPFEWIEIATVDAEAETLTPAYASGTGVSEDDEGVSSPLAGSPVEEAVRTRSPFLFRAQAIEEVEARFPALVPAVEAGLRSFIAAPIVRSGEVIGAISLGSSRLDAHADEHLVMAERVGLQLASALPSTPTAGEAEPETGELRILNKIGRIVTSSLDLGEVYGLLAEEVRKLLPFDRIVVWTVDLQRENLIASYVWGADASGQEQGRSFPLSSAAAQGVLSARSAATVVEESAGALAGRFPDLLRQAKPGQPAMLLVPLESGDETVGMLSLRSATSTGYTERDVAVAERIGAQIIGAVANAQVYLECKQVEEAVREAVEKLDMAVWGSGHGLWDWKIDENEVWWSQRYKELLDYREQDDASPEGWESRLHPEDRDRALRALTGHLDRRAPYDVEYRLRTDSGEYRWFSDSGRAIWDETGKPVRMSGSLKDVTEAKEGTGPVDLREALATIEDFRQRLLEGRTAREDADDDVFVTRSTSAGRRVAKLVEDLQTLAWAMDSELRREPVDLSAVARSIVRMLHKTPGKRDIEFSIAKGLVAEGDARLLRAMMENLLGNAYRSTADRQGARVRFGADEQDGKTVFHVRDNGAGFDMAHADRLFRLFQRLHPRDEVEGTGVGLAIVRHIVTRHGGSVWAEGEVGHGATFYFTL